MAATVCTLKTILLAEKCQGTVRVILDLAYRCKTAFQGLTQIYLVLTMPSRDGITIFIQELAKRLLTNLLSFNLYIEYCLESSKLFQNISGEEKNTIVAFTQVLVETTTHSK